MAQQGRWPLEKENADAVDHKLGECIWWLMVLADRTKIDLEKALEEFLAKTEKQLEG